MKRFYISFEVREDSVGLILGLLSGHVTKWNISEVENGGGSRRAPSKNNPSHAPAKESRSWIAATKYLDTVKIGTDFRRDQFATAFTKEGFAEKSFSPMLTHLRRQGYIDVVATGVFKRLK